MILINIIESNDSYINKKNKNNDADYLQNLYNSYRKEADNIADVILNKALLNNFNIVWETTGNTIAWTIKEIKRIQKKGYSVIIVYPIVDPDELVLRSIRRQKKTGQTPAPPQRIINTAFSAIRNLKKLVNFVSQIYVFDNTDDPPSLILHIKNNWTFTPEDSKYGPGLEKNIVCDKIDIKSRKFPQEIIDVLIELCDK